MKRRESNEHSLAMKQAILALVANGRIQRYHFSIGGCCGMGIDQMLGDASGPRRMYDEQRIQLSRRPRFLICDILVRSIQKE